MEKLTHEAEELLLANQKIADSIQTISAVSEEVTAHSTATMQAEAENSDIINRVSEKMEMLMKLTK